VHMVNSTFQNLASFSSSLMWVRVVTQTVGYSLMAVSYVVAGRFQGTSRRSYLIILLGVTALILSAFGLLFLFSDPAVLASVYSYIGIFTMVNLALLSYIILFLFRKIQLAKGGFKDLLSAPLAFVFLWIGQFSFLIWSVTDGGTIILIASQVARIMSFVLFVQIYYVASKEF